MNWFYVYALVLMVSCLLTGILRRYALKTSLVDVPNHRSSHCIPTPRGGGLSFIICFSVLVLFFFYSGNVSFSLTLALVGGGLFVALVGLLDDYLSISARWRLVGHFIACGSSLYLLGGMPAIFLFNTWLSPGWISNGLGLFYLVWLLNLYNFMDGIDGIAALEAVTVCFCAAVLYVVHAEAFLLLLPLSLAFAVAGFLYWNFPPARIFMGDAGSGFLGFVLGVFSIQAASINADFFWGWLILMGVFIVDATVTLLCRAYHGQRLIEAHCTHAYQYAARHYGNHRVVTLAVFALTLFWLFPWALLVSNKTVNGILGLLVAYLPLVILAFTFKAGKKVLFP